LDIECFYGNQMDVCWCQYDPDGGRNHSGNYKGSQTLRIFDLLRKLAIG